jgi:hypothetical protein
MNATELNQSCTILLLHAGNLPVPTSGVTNSRDDAAASLMGPRMEL